MNEEELNARMRSLHRISLCLMGFALFVFLVLCVLQAVYAVVWLLLCGFYIVCGWAVGGMEFHYYPTIFGAQSGAFQISFMLAYLLLCLTPLILDATEDEKWKHLRSAA